MINDYVNAPMYNNAWLLIKSHVALMYCGFRKSPIYY